MFKLILSILDVWERKLRFLLKDTFQAEHECRFLQGDIIDNFPELPKCAKCGAELSNPMNL